MALPDLNKGPLPLGQLREEARRLLVEALDSRRGKKVLVLDPQISGFLGLLAEVALLKEHGVEQLLHLGSEPLGPLSVRSVIFLVRSEVANAQLVAAQIQQSNMDKTGLDFAVFFTPARTVAAERALQEAGVYGDCVVGEFPLGFVPLDADVLSLEYDGTAREILAEGDRGCLHGVARALGTLQAATGGVARIKGKGPSAAALRRLLARMRREAGAAAPPLGGGAEELVIIDRETDAITPLCMQLTYEGLVDETLRLRYGAVQLPTPSGGKQRVMLNSADPVYAGLRDLSFAAVGPVLGERAKAIQADYRGSKAPERSMAELRDFAAQLKALPAIQRHIGIAEAVNAAISAPAFRARVAVEQALLDGHGVDAATEQIEEMMFAGEELYPVLRLLCLLSLTQGGVPRKHWDALRRELLHTYGHEHLLTLAALQDAGLLRRQEGGKSGFGALKRAFRLLVDDVDDKDPQDIAYVFSGYAPLTVRLVEGAVRGPGWGVPEDALKLLPGPAFEVAQAADEAGLPVERPAPPRAPAAGAEPGKRKVVIVMFIGGVTFAEISALRFLSRRPELNCQFIIATTKLLNGTTFLESFVDPDVRATLALRATLS